jgi:hypothetical protein
LVPILAIGSAFASFSQKALLFKPLDCTCFIAAFLAHHQVEHSPALARLEITPAAGFEL